MTHLIYGLPTLPSGWRLVPFEEVLVDGTRNGIYKPKSFHGRGVKVVNMGELFAHPRIGNVDMRRIEVTDSELSRFELATGDLLFARRSLVAEGAGKCSIVLRIDEPTVFESSIIRARLSSEADPLFFYYFFSSRFGAAALDSIRRQVAVAGITGSDLRGLHVPLPPPQVQAEIAALLAALDDKIELNRRMNQTLEALVAASLYRATDLAGMRPLRELASASRESIDPSALPEELFHHFSIPAFDDRRGPSVDLGGSIRSKKLVVYPDAVLVSKLNPRIPRVWLPFVSGAHPAICSTEFVVLRPAAWAPRALVYAAVRSRAFLEDLASLATGTSGSHQRAKVDDILSLDVPIPDDSGAFVARAEPLLERVSANEHESRTLAALRDALLPKLISGELRIRDAEALEEAG